MNQKERNNHEQGHAAEQEYNVLNEHDSTVVYVVHEFPHRM